MPLQGSCLYKGHAQAPNYFHWSSYLPATDSILSKRTPSVFRVYHLWNSRMHFNRATHLGVCGWGMYVILFWLLVVSNSGMLHLGQFGRMTSLDMTDRCYFPVLSGIWHHCIPHWTWRLESHYTQASSTLQPTLLWYAEYFPLVHNLVLVLWILFHSDPSTGLVHMFFSLHKDNFL